LNPAFLYDTSHLLAEKAISNLSYFFLLRRRPPTSDLNARQHVAQYFTP